VKQLNVDDRTSVHEMPFIMELWRSVKYDGDLPETVFVQFFPSEQLPRGRRVRVTIEIDAASIPTAREIVDGTWKNET
jgi:hypothetical protein